MGLQGHHGWDSRQTENSVGWRATSSREELRQIAVRCRVRFGVGTQGNLFLISQDIHIANMLKPVLLPTLSRAKGTPSSLKRLGLGRKLRLLGQNGMSWLVI
jgi:hypothetical protein